MLPANSAAKKQTTVLVVDDEAGLRDMLVFGLTDRGYCVSVAANGQEGIEKMQHEPFDLAVCDIMMPDISGVDVLKVIKEHQPKTQVIMATGCASLETAIEAMKLGAYDYITKPYEIEQLVAIFEKALEHQQLKNRIGDLEELNKLKSEFLANMSHELRTPMNAIIGYGALLMDRVYGEINAKQEQGIKRIQINAKNLLDLINNILDFSKLSAGRMPLYTESFAIKDVTDEVMETLDCLARDKKIKLSASVEPDLRIKADKTKIKQVLVNLVTNAIKFTQDGEVSIRVEKFSSPESIRFYVQDTGMGIDKKDLSLLFQEFRQLDASPTRQHGGTGLGLSICKKIIELHGGTIQVESTRGVGSTFYFTLPVEAKTTTPDMPTPKHPLGKNKNEKIILGIDDDPEVLTLLSDSLIGTGYTFVGAQSGEEGLALARQINPHLITLDIMMPHMDGWSVLQTLKSDAQLRSIPVFIISIVENKALGFSLGVADYIVKPFDRQSLVEKIKRCPLPAPKQILVIDDTPDGAEALKKEGYTVDLASNSEEALVKLVSVQPDVLFLDLMSQRANGNQILNEIQKNESLKNLRIIVMTGKNLSPDEVSYLENRVEMIVQGGSKSVDNVLTLLKEKINLVKEGSPL
jgi:signal transduction histidine kinase